MRELKITLDIGPDGAVTADADGFTGDACLRDLERLLADLATPPEVLQRKSDGGAHLRATAAPKLTAGRKP